MLLPVADANTGGSANLALARMRSVPGAISTTEVKALVGTKSSVRRMASLTNCGLLMLVRVKTGLLGGLGIC